jgi:hypothetical protein
MSDSEKRKYTRYDCSIKSKFFFHVGHPEELDISTDVPQKGKGTIVDISRGGVFLTSHNRVQVGMPIILKFSLNKQKMDIQGHILRTGLIENNPTEIAKKFLKHVSKGDSYIAVEFNELMNEFHYTN